MKINLNFILKLLVTATVVSILFLVYSCAAKKTTTSKISEKAKTETVINSVVEKKEESNLKTTETTTVDDKNQTTTKETVYEPLDNSKPASVIDPDGKETKLNNSKKTTRETTQNNNTKTDNSLTTSESRKAELSENIKSLKKEVAEKTVDDRKSKKDSSYYKFLWFLIPIGIIYFIWHNKVAIGKKLTNIWWI